VLSILASSDLPFLVIGRAGMDLYPNPPGTRIEEATNFSAELGGSSGNIAAALSRFEQSTWLATSVSNDAIGRFVVQQLANYGIGTDLVHTVDGDVRTSLALAESRIENQQTIIYRNQAADFQMSVAHIEAIDFSQFRAVVVTGTCLTLEPSRAATLLALKRAKAAGVLTVLDLDYRPYSWQSASAALEVYQQAVECVDLLVGNDDEFGHMSGSYAQGEAYARSLALRNKWVIYKRGAQGSLAFAPQSPAIETGIYSVTALKPIGAGDAFLGGLLASLSRAEPFATALLQASACAAMVVARVGCAPAMPTLAELNEFQAAHSADQHPIGDL